MRKLVLLIILSILFLSGCKSSTEPVSPEKKPPGYQENITWPSLANSPWAMYRHDPQSTGRTSFTGPLEGIVQVKVDTTTVIQSGVSIGNNSVVYFNAFSQNLFGVDYSGNVVLHKDFNSTEAFCTPIISRDSVLYFALATAKKLIAMNEDGSLKWSKDWDAQIWAEMNIDREGNLYLLDEGKTLYAISKNGDVLWSYNDPSFNGYSYSVLTFSPDGRTLYIPGSGPPSLIAFDVMNQTIKWKFGASVLRAAPIVDSQGNVYILSYTNADSTSRPAFYSIKPDGTIRWKYQFVNKLKRYAEGYFDPTIDWNGNLYLATEDSVFSFDYQGNLRWKKGYKISSTSLICDKFNNIYFSVWGSIIALSDKGEVVWKIDYDPTQQAAPAINDKKQLFFPSFTKGMLIIE